MKRFYLALSILALTLLNSCNTSPNCQLEGRWVLASYSNTMWIFTDSLQYTLYDLDSTGFGGIDEALPGPHTWSMDGDTLVVDLNFGNELRALPVFDCNCNVLDLMGSTSTITLHTEGYDIQDCQ
ncbi:MAG: hypothetical protein RL754_1423 [Bacteroidota bacterium]|jgi:hypothetical protein